MNQLRTVKEQALRDGNEDQVEQLISILDALTACVSSLHERNHEALIHEVLTIPIWKTCQVRPFSTSTILYVTLTLATEPHQQALLFCQFIGGVWSFCPPRALPLTAGCQDGPVAATYPYGGGQQRSGASVSADPCSGNATPFCPAKAGGGCSRPGRMAAGYRHCGDPERGHSSFRKGDLLALVSPCLLIGNTVISDLLQVDLSVQ